MARNFNPNQQDNASKTQTPVEEIVSSFNGAEIRRKSQFVVSFGPTHGTGMTLRSFGAAMGFLNALMDIADKKYHTLEYGYHLKKDPTTFMDAYSIDDVGHFAYMARPEGKQENSPLQPAPENQAFWHVLNVRQGHLKLGKVVRPLNSADLAGPGREVKDITKPEWIRNNEMWGRWFKYEGIEKAMRVNAGHARVTIALKAEELSEQQPAIFEAKLALLGKGITERDADRASRVESGRAYRETVLGEYYVATIPEVKQAAEAKAEIEQIDVEAFVGHYVQMYQGTEKVGGRKFCRNLDAVLGAINRAAKFEASLVIADNN